MPLVTVVVGCVEGMRVFARGGVEIRGGGEGSVREKRDDNETREGGLVSNFLQTAVPQRRSLNSHDEE